MRWKEGCDKKIELERKGEDSFFEFCISCWDFFVDNENNLEDFEVGKGLIRFVFCKVNFGNFV